MWKWIYNVFHLLYEFCDHVIDRLCNFVDKKSALEPTTLTIFLAIVLAEVEM